MSSLDLRHYRNPSEVRDLLVNVYAEVYAHELNEPFSTIEAFSDRLAGHVTIPRWECVVGYDDAEPVAYIYGGSLRATTSWWHDLDPPVCGDFIREDGHRTLGIFELMVRRPWRKTGAAHAIHEELLADRPEQRASLAVDHAHPRVRAMYERWGYRFVGAHRPPGIAAPLLDIMVRDLRPS
ncbi:GNAT family N-acetyltransferase [Cryptosporangium aurantiacum]|uniref:N-acetyltransferase domain-containing protein n=1 Tax=Cryptosporangium aurantiacum TaxID=134849 RepID=A0A1M7PQ17_9ACTN|nr:GNAT family N-acetyltransferase [Cryptosporangium aurantiacum]SHN19291.1 hypothetical protein SAMN05443668_103562 [Cryptosporangium aurantiacum]